jgi:hypothetical protein
LMNPHKMTGLVVLFVLLVFLSAFAAGEAFGPSADGEHQATDWTVTQGFDGNEATAGSLGITISGGGGPGAPNRVTADLGVIGGGLGNLASGYATVGGGSHNAASAFRTTVGGGSHNVASVEYAVVSGGSRNVASATRATVGGGYGNTASHIDATVGGGGGNTASGKHATVSGGSQNSASGFDAMIGGGSYNTASGTYATVGGGSQNIAAGFDATIAGGAGNVVSGTYATAGGGLSNRAMDSYATVGGGYGNTGSGAFSTLPGGALNQAAGDYSFAAGRRAVIAPHHDGAFLFADSTDANFNSAAASEFAVRASGGVRLVTAVDSDGHPLAGVRLAPGSGSWSSLSDRGVKTNVTPLDRLQILTLLAELPISSWSYTSQDPAIRHAGPMAQDFYAAFGLGEDERHISAVDADGVALAAIQGLYQVMREQEAQIAALEARVLALEQTSKENNSTRPTLSFGVPAGWLLLVGFCLAGWRLKHRWSN